jgi:molybdopterin-synthase adenylyltransferase
MADPYFDFTTRNSGYISTETQEKIRNMHLFIAGCGIGSQAALALARLGVTRFTLIDGDTVSPSNLNRQSYYFDQIGLNKSKALADNIRRVNPNAQVNICDFHFSHAQVNLLKDVDLIIDTIDFLDLSAILHLHEAAEKFRIPLLTGMSVGWGSCAIYFANQNEEKHQFRNIFALEDNPSEPYSYALKFAQLFERIQDCIDPQVVSVMRDVLVKLANNQPCPAPQVIGGSTNLASMISILVFQHVNGDKIPESPYLMISDMNKIIKQSLFKLI